MSEARSTSSRLKRSNTAYVKQNQRIQRLFYRKNS